MLRNRRRPRYGAHVCAVISAVLLLLSVSLLYTRLSHSPSHYHPFHQQNHNSNSQNDVVSSNDSSADKIDELEIVDEDQQQHQHQQLNDDVIESEDEENHNSESNQHPRVGVSGGYFFDHVSGTIRRAFNKRSIDEWDDDRLGFVIIESTAEDKSRAAFGSDDLPVDEIVRRKASEVRGIEDALLLKTTVTGRRGGNGRASSVLREGWGDWFDKKSDFLRRDKMFRSNFEVLNPLNNPMLQDPDSAFGVPFLTRGDRLVQKGLLNEFKRVPFITKRNPLVKRAERRTLDDENVGNNGLDLDANRLLRSSHQSDKKNVGNGLNSERVVDSNDGVLSLSHKNVKIVGNGLSNERVVDSNNGVLSLSHENDKNVGNGLKNVDDDMVKGNSEFSNHMYADGKRWGYYPGLHSHFSFSDFMDTFFRKGKCDMRVFMVWNSPPWMYSVRQQRGLESLLSQHRDACVVVFSETIELDFFKDSFVKDGYKVAVAMPNLDELLKDLPTHIFASVWFEWRKTKFYPTHYSELVRLAALYKYGGLYLDSDIIVLNPLYSLNNSVGMEDQLAGSSFNGAVMAFRRHSPFIMECLKEFYMTYDDTRLRWNGADLLTRVARKFMSQENTSIKQLELNVQPSFIFFPISSQNITRYFTAPATEAEKARQDASFRKILNESLTFHFWNSLTSALIPEPDSLVTKLMNHPCIRCSDVL